MSHVEAFATGIKSNQSHFVGPTSLVPRPHPLMRRNGLVNQVEFLGLVHTFATM